MLTYVMDVGDLSEVRFVISPLTETTLSLFRLHPAPKPAPHLDRWRANALALREQYDFPLLAALVSPSGRMTPDFLTPVPDRDRMRPTLESQLEAIAATDPDTVHRHLTAVGEGAPPCPTLAQLLDDDHAAERIAGALGRYHDVVIAPIWSVISRILESDVTFRGGELAAGGPSRLFGALTSSVTWCREGYLQIALPCTTVEGDVDSSGRGLTLLPSVFVGSVATAHDPLATTPHVSYPARGSALMGESLPPVAPGAIRQLMGAAKADILAALEQPTSVSDLAQLLQVTPSAISQSVRVLLQNNLVERSRLGRTVLYRRSQVGDLLIDAHHSA